MKIQRFLSVFLLSFAMMSASCNSSKPVDQAKGTDSVAAVGNENAAPAAQESAVAAPAAQESAVAAPAAQEPAVAAPAAQEPAVAAPAAQEPAMDSPAVAMDAAVDGAAEANDVVAAEGDVVQDNGEEAAVQVAEPVADQNSAHRIDSMDPLSEAQSKLLSDIVWDMDPEVLNAVLQKNEGGHFPFSDEKHLDLFQKSIENLGGTYIGVGTDQGYLFMGWQRPTLGFVIDYDPWVVTIHKIYMAFWRQCEDSACLHHYFDDRDAGLELMQGEFGVAAQLDGKEPIKIYKSTQKSIARQLKRLEHMKVKTFMNDAETFTFIKTMIESGRIRTLQANLLGDRAFKSIAETLNALGAKVTTMYLSNAEQYWGYSEQFKKNIIGLPASDNALILRTSATYPANNDYRYSIQPISVFKAWLSHPDGKNVRNVTKRVRVKDETDFPFVVDDFMPPETNTP